MSSAESMAITRLLPPSLAWKAMPFTVGLCAAAALAHHSAASIALSVVLIPLVVAAGLVDFRHYIIPNKITGLGVILALVIGAALDPSGEPIRLIAGIAMGGLYLAVAATYPVGLGMGDVKLVGMMGLFLGAPVIPAVLIALLSGVIVGVAILVRRKTQMRRKTMIPLGPFLAFGAVVAVFCGQPIVDAYVNTFLH